MKKKLHNKPEIRTNRKFLRKNLTPTETFLWKHLQNKKLEGRKFRRQHSIENYVVDFYCAQEKLIVELDGQIHLDPEVKEKDDIRDLRLNNLGFTIVRFENKMVFEHLPSVLQEIKDHFK